MVSLLTHGLSLPTLNPDTLQAQIEQYFASIPKNQPPTLAGLAYHLGFYTREDFFEVCKPKTANNHSATRNQSPDIQRIMLRARLRIIDWWEAKLADREAYHGAQWWLSRGSGGHWLEPVDAESRGIDMLAGIWELRKLLGGDQAKPREATQALPEVVDIEAEDVPDTVDS